MGIETVIPSTVRLQRKMQNFQVSKLLTYLLLLFFSILDLTLGYASYGAPRRIVVATIRGY